VNLETGEKPTGARKSWPPTLAVAEASAGAITRTPLYMAPEMFRSPRPRTSGWTSTLSGPSCTSS
jgi:hypothetical protein